MGGVDPNNKLTILINVESRKNFSGKPEETFAGKNVCVTGKCWILKENQKSLLLRPTMKEEVAFLKSEPWTSYALSNSSILFVPLRNSKGIV